METSPLLQLKDLHVEFSTYGGKVHAVRGVNLELFPSETLAIVGESGCGKSVTAQSILQLLPKPPVHYPKGEILFHGNNLLNSTPKEIRSIRGKQISMVFQDPMTALNPSMRIGRQIEEGIRQHQRISRQESRAQALELMELVGIPQADKRIDQYPHEFSGGMRQRVVIAIALACRPEVLIADEPTTALDVTIQAQIMELLAKLQKQLSMSIILITHDLGVVAGHADRVAVMYAGKVVETGDTDSLFENPQHPYTKALLDAVPDLSNPHKALSPIHGTPPDLFSPLQSCSFAPRCDYAMKVCHQQCPDFQQQNSKQASACWLNHPHAKEQKRAFDTDKPVQQEVAS